MRPFLRALTARSTWAVVRSSTEVRRVVPIKLHSISASSMSSPPRTERTSTIATSRFECTGALRNKRQTNTFDATLTNVVLSDVLSNRCATVRNPHLVVPDDRHRIKLPAVAFRRAPRRAIPPVGIKSDRESTSDRIRTILYRPFRCLSLIWKWRGILLLRATRFRFLDT